jgi:hypothetical protein
MTRIDWFLLIVITLLVAVTVAGYILARRERCRIKLNSELNIIVIRDIAKALNLNLAL